MALTIDDHRRRARRRLPRFVFDFVDGGAEDEACLRRNRQAPALASNQNTTAKSSRYSRD